MMTEPATPAAVPSAPADRAAILRQAADALEGSERLRDLTDDHMHDVHAAANELRRMADEAPLSPDYQHPDCGFHWHGRDGMDIPVRDGQPVCPRCELDRVRAERDRYLAALTRLDQMATAWLERLPDAIRTATAAEAVHYVVRSALHPLPGSATVRPVRYEVSVLPEANINYPVYALAVEDRGGGRWAVVRHGSCLGADGTWELGVGPYDRDDAWLNAHRFDLETALRLAEETAPTVVVNGITAAEVAARSAEGSDH